ncbi:hypothetical protein J6590_041523, partial [Homalodisca vitripennis]
RAISRELDAFKTLARLRLRTTNSREQRCSRRYLSKFLPVYHPVTAQLLWVWKITRLTADRLGLTIHNYMLGSSHSQHALAGRLSNSVLTGSTEQVAAVNDTD